MRSNDNAVLETSGQTTTIQANRKRGNVAQQMLLTAVAAVALVGSVAPAANAQGRWDGDHARQEEHHDDRDHRNDRDNRGRDRDHRNDRDNRFRDNDHRDDQWRNNDHRSDYRDRIDAENANRQRTKNTWRDLALAGGGVAVLGVLEHDWTLTFAGALGGLYSLNRYEQDRRSQSDADRARARFFERGAFDRDGRHFERVEEVHNGQRYWRFARR